MLDLTISDAVATIRIDRPERRNALDVATCRELALAVGEALVGGARAAVVTGTGSTFCSGADFGEVYGQGFRDALYAALHALADAPIPVVAAVNGPAIGAGTQLAIACDLRVAVPEAAFAVPTARIGLAVDPWTVRRLGLLAGGGPARALILGCDTVDAQRAHVVGLVDRLVATDAAGAALDWAGDLARLAPLTLAYSKRALDAGYGAGVDPAELAAAFERCWASEDLAEGRAARADKRSPRFVGR